MKKIFYLTMCLVVGFASCSEDKEKSDGDFYKSGTEKGHDYVDFGLPSKTLWATCNVGALKPIDYGSYYAWGDVGSVATFTWNTYKYADGADDQLTKYCTKSSYGKGGLKDNKTVLELSDDVASVSWGGKWRMPTKIQYVELQENCYWVWVDNYNDSNVAGFVVYKPKTSNDKGVVVYGGESPLSSYSYSDAHIFLPAAGFYYNGSNISLQGSTGNYWSSSLNSDFPSYAWVVTFTSNNMYCLGSLIYRYCGQTVRPVFVP
ncbi:MAG: hypothetical protein IJP79_01120 [Paludibacteraceae bacterium]|nr:hypothetical protein [Paludibacteraceae bacterium]MBQ6962297.1 hypothetical protein [Paludibacteraceae bacterium]MBQ7748028.1 hypothetical protein [Paludibacteraceae bacterium]MBR0497805.1 hypothetical protein [Paludibacteraceae bacterium]